MSMYRQLYFGPYIRVWMPETEYEVDRKTCTNFSKCGNYGIYLHTEFCEKCGSEVKNITIKMKSQLNLNEFLEEELDDEDLFTPVYPDDADFILAVPNCGGQGGTNFEDSPDTEILVISDRPRISDMTIFDQKDWKKFITALFDKKIKHERKIGVLQWRS